MKPSVAFQKYRKFMVKIIEKHNVNNPRIFGSVLYAQDTEESDLDILVETSTETTLFDLGALQAELTELLGVRVDIVPSDSLPDRCRYKILNESQGIETFELP